MIQTINQIQIKVEPYYEIEVYLHDENDENNKNSQNQYDNESEKEFDNGDIKLISDEGEEFSDKDNDNDNNVDDWDWDD